MTGRRIAMIACGLLSMLAAAPATAQVPAPARIEGQIDASDPADPSGRRYDEYAVELVGGQRVRIMVAASGGAAVPSAEIWGAVPQLWPGLRRTGG